MATAKVETVIEKVVVDKEVPKTFVLELTPDEAAVLRAMTGWVNTGGYTRDLTSDIFHALCNAGASEKFRGSLKNYISFDEGV